MPEQILGISPFSVRSRRSSSSVSSSDTLTKSSDGGGAGMSEGGRVRRKRRSRIPVRQATGLYVHSSPPTVVPVHPSIVRQWLRGGEINRLQEIVLKKKIEELHAAARIGEIEHVDTILKSEPRVNLELSRDNSGTGLLHKAVMHGHVPLQEWLLKNYPKTVEVLDKEKRNPLHYAGGNEEVWNRLVAGGADTSTVDREGYSPAFYMNHPRRLRPPAPESRKAISQANQGIVVKPSNIRIWIHDKDLGRLQKVMWEGMGDKLKTETSSQPLVRRFLNAVPYIMGSIRDVHNAAVSNDVELLKSKSSDPVPKDILLSKDANGLNALHKAAGLGNMEVARAIIDRAPEAVNSKDNLDRTPLHYAAALKDENQMYQLLVDSNATDHLEDKKGNTPSHYRARPSDLDGPKLLSVIPDAPRTAHIFPPSWDWRLLTGDATTDSPMASPQVEAPPQIPDAPPQIPDAPPQIPDAPPQIPDAKEPEEPRKQVEERQVDDKPPEIEPSPEEESQEEQEESKDATEPPGISDDEGVGSEANPSVENTSTPLSDTVNEEEEISGARLGETMTLTTSLFSSNGPRIEESINGTDSGNEDGDQSENRMINVENGEVEYPQVDTSDPPLSNLQGTTEENLDGPLDVKIEGATNEEQDQQNESENPGDRQGDIIQEMTDEQLRSTSDTPQSDKGEPKPNLDGQTQSEADPITTIQSSEQERDIILRDESVSREEQTEMPENIKNNSGEQTDNQNNLTNSDSIKMQAEEGAKSEEEQNVEAADETQDSNQTLGSTQDLNATYTKIPLNDATEAEKEGKNDTTVNMTDETPSTQNQYTEPPVDRSPSSLQDQLVGEESEDPLENNSKLVEESHQSEGTEDIPADVAQNQNPDQSNEGVALENISASNSRPSSRKSEVGTPRSRLSSSANKPGQEEIDNKNIENKENPSLEHQLEGNGEQEIENEAGILGISNEPEDGNDSGSAVRSGLDPVEIVDDGSMLGSQENVEQIEGSLDSTIVKTKEEEDVRGGEEPTGDGEAEDVDSSELMDRPITTRSAGGSRAEILAITPAPPDEEDVLEGDDQKAVQGTGEEDRTAAEELVAAGDMESMAEMVLNGRGSALLNMSSTNSDVQLFINNIPQYIAKIERVHVAAREGDLRGVQTALDRRKFAVARDNSTPLKPTPLHVAALFGRTSVLRYLAGRFPETMHAQDAGGRTALHYAATLPDNGHFYSLLVTLGADKSVIDNEGRTAEYYLRNKGELSREELLNEYQNRPVPVDTTGLNFNRFSDKGYWEWNNEKKQYLQIPRIGAELIKGGYPIFNSDEGQYLADSLGEPLIKGLTEVAHVRPKNPVVHLANFLLVYSKPEEGGTNNNRIPSAKRAVTAGMEDAPAEGSDTNGEEQVEDIADQFMDGEPMGNEETMEGEVEEERDREELEDKEDEEETLDGDNASVEEDPPEPVDPAFKPTNRDEHGQTILHFAAARSHGRNAIFQLLQEMDVNVGLRDGLYRTARDISEQMEINENVQGIDKFVVALAARGENDKLTELLLEGYDHILDAEDGENIMDIANERENVETVELLQGITAFEERREKLIRAIRFGSMRQVRELFGEAPNKRHLAVAKNQQGRCSLHVAVLAQHENIVEYISERFPATLHIGDNLMRAPLHYAMGVDKVEPLSRLLIAAGAQRVVKDLKGRQPSYYFMSKTDIQKLQDEEEALRV